MMAAARTPIEPDHTDLDQEIADLWADGFDTVDIAEALAGDGHRNERGKPIDEADVHRTLWRLRSGKAERARG
ncbi:hypothetical protein [Methylobacterium gnaphalii]|uniref:Uncharacterized protein n=1 Tax=Methylobacterium gnaphalii TaxID=1010610 RepID=A0A512JNZ8_9HYPH|nr:hypothetical protein [Methylobacterium gnaphalii]GEP11681.1 hypothetical protein MGN01_35260 [Methylobacterium gnaphalii]GJD71342.1 hypothetical protein MMMDOFMJ_4298 [Methylobacterium gnaphalii]GLS50179.1 hypothetical protein GCM10007885_30310 [Methylobacterium gnaphalii]